MYFRLDSLKRVLLLHVNLIWDELYSRPQHCPSLWPLLSHFLSLGVPFPHSSWLALLSGPVLRTMGSHLRPNLQSSPRRCLCWLAHSHISPLSMLLSSLSPCISTGAPQIPHCNFLAPGSWKTGNAQAAVGTHPHTSVFSTAVDTNNTRGLLYTTCIGITLFSFWSKGKTRKMFSEC